MAQSLLREKQESAIMLSKAKDLHFACRQTGGRSFALLRMTDKSHSDHHLSLCGPVSWSSAGVETTERLHTCTACFFVPVLFPCQLVVGKGMIPTSLES